MYLRKGFFPPSVCSYLSCTWVHLTVWLNAHFPMVLFCTQILPSTFLNWYGNFVKLYILFECTILCRLIVCLFCLRVSEVNCLHEIVFEGGLEVLLAQSPLEWPIMVHYSFLAHTFSDFSAQRVCKKRMKAFWICSLVVHCKLQLFVLRNFFFSRMKWKSLLNGIWFRNHY